MTDWLSVSIKLALDKRRSVQDMDKALGIADVRTQNREGTTP